LSAAIAGVNRTECQSIGVRVWSRIEHLRQNDAGKRTERRAQLVDSQPLIGQAFRQSSRSDLV
jgi:hypothetical protein